MSAAVNKEIQLEIAHVLFIDIVGYSKLLIDEQRDYLHTLNEVVRETDSFRAAEAAGKLTRLPTGDGMALVFATTPDAPVSCALQVSKALRSQPELRVRMGIHSGPVSGITDVNDRSNVAGAGINLAQRVMDCGDAGHILLPKRVAADVEQYRQWRSHLHDLGECDANSATDFRTGGEACATSTHSDCRADYRCGPGRRRRILHSLASAHADRAAFCKRTDASSSGNSRKVDCGASL